MTLIDTINTDFQQSEIFGKYLAVGEIIVKYYGNISLRQFIFGETEMFGCKLWTLRRTN
jgi:hypothetical protein